MHLKKDSLNMGLVLNFVIKEFKIKYKNSVLGFLWAVLYPLSMILILLLVFTKLFRYDLPYYPSYLLIGLLVWNFFSETTNMAMVLFVEQANIYTKTSVNKNVGILSLVLFGTIDFLLKLLILLSILIFLRYYLIWPTLLRVNLTIILIIPAILLEFLLIIGVSYILSTVYVYFKDLRNIWWVFLQLGFFLTPIFYPDSLIPYKFLLIFNPLHHIITIFRDVTIHGKIPHAHNLLLATVFSLIILIIGVYVFNKLKDRIVEKL